jgi:hypothetical protein
MEDSNDFSLFTSVRYDTMLLQSQENESLRFIPNCPLYMAVFHRDRVLEAAQFFGFKSNANFLEDGEEFQKQITSAIETYFRDNSMEDTPLRVNSTPHSMMEGLFTEVATGKSCLRQNGQAKFRDITCA